MGGGVYGKGKSSFNAEILSGTITCKKLREISEVKGRIVEIILTGRGRRTVDLVPLQSNDS